MRPNVTNVTGKKGWKAKALKALAGGASVTEAATAAGVDRRTVYRAIEGDPEFAASYEDAVEQGTDLIESAATNRAVIGVEEPVIYQGQLTFVGVDKDGNHCDPLSPLAVRNVPLTVRKPSDTLAIFILKGRRPEKFRDNIKVEQSGPGGKPVEVNHTFNDGRFADLYLRRTGGNRAGAGPATPDRN